MAWALDEDKKDYQIEPEEIRRTIIKLRKSSTSFNENQRVVGYIVTPLWYIALFFNPIFF